MLLKVPKTRKYADYKAAAYIVALPEIYHKGGKEYFNNNGLSLTRIKENDFSSGYKTMLELLSELFYGTSRFYLLDGILNFDQTNFDIMLQAMKLRRGF